MPDTMSQLSRPPSRDFPLQRRLSIEETYHLADTARRKSSDRMVRDDLRLKLSHSHILGMVLQDIARNEREHQTSPSTSTPDQGSSKCDRHITWDLVETPKKKSNVDEYGYGYDDDGEEDLAGLALTRTHSKKPTR